MSYISEWQNFAHIQVRFVNESVWSISTLPSSHCVCRHWVLRREGGLAQEQGRLYRRNRHRNNSDCHWGTWCAPDTRNSIEFKCKKKKRNIKKRRFQVKPVSSEQAAHQLKRRKHGFMLWNIGRRQIAQTPFFSFLCNFSGQNMMFSSNMG